MNIITSAIVIVLLLFLMSGLTNTTFIETVFKISNVFKQNNLNSILIYTCSNGLYQLLITWKKIQFTFR